MVSRAHGRGDLVALGIRSGGPYPVQCRPITIRPAEFGQRLISVLALAALPGAVALAQYPAPAGVCTVTPDSNDVQPNSVATFTVRTAAANGAPAPKISGTVKLATGSTGTVSTPTFTTNAHGTAAITVQVGPSGQVSLDVTCGAINTSGVVRVTSPSVLTKPPSTGSGLADGGSFPLLMLLGGLALAGAVSTGALAMIRRRR